eukprot:s793_g1.t3
MVEVKLVTRITSVLGMETCMTTALMIMAIVVMASMLLTTLVVSLLVLMLAVAGTGPGSAAEMLSACDVLTPIQAMGPGNASIPEDNVLHNSSGEWVRVRKQASVQSKARWLTECMPSGVAPSEQHDETKQGTWRRQLETAAVVSSWFVLNITIASSTKWIFVHGKICIQDRGCTQYQFPVAITVIHMIFSWLLCRVYIFQFRGGLEGKSLGLAQQAREIMPLSLCFALSVAMGNLSLKYIYPSFNQMLGSMSPLITVLLAVVMQQKRFPLKTWLSMPVICVGLAVCKELNFNALGAFYASGAAVLRAVKSLIQGRLLSTSHQMDSVTLLYYMAPWAAMWLSLIMLVLEGGEPVFLLLAVFDPQGTSWRV